MQIFSPSLKRQLKDCILAIFWPKKDVYSFFKDCSVPVNVLKTIDDWDEKKYLELQWLTEFLVLWLISLTMALYILILCSMNYQSGRILMIIDLNNNKSLI